ncbi:MAG: GNAT family N-acetyltransferase [Anaerovorax sp.]|nr:GNAT family N-acetyltransferase [Anaerovorax sp.]
MISILRKKLFLKVNEIYFVDKELEKKILKGADIVFYIQASKKLLNSRIFTTNHINLKLGLEDLFNNITKNTRYEIRRAIRQDKWEIQHIDQPNKEEIQLLCERYNQFAIKKNITSANFNKLVALKEANALVISKAHVGGYWVCHVYVKDCNRARLLYSFHYVDHNLNENKSLLGRGNRLLHWEDIQYYKQNGLNVYDFGGAGKQDEKVRNITKFKEEFGGFSANEYNKMQGITFLGKAVVYVFEYAHK